MKNDSTKDDASETNKTDANSDTINIASLSKANILSEVENKKPVSAKLTLPSIGLSLTKIVLIIIGVFILFIIFYLLFDKPCASNCLTIPDKNLSDSLTFNRNLEVLKLHQVESEKKREFLLQISQLVLLNLLLPIVTGLLGHIFSSGKRNDEKE